MSAERPAAIAPDCPCPGPLKGTCPDCPYGEAEFMEIVAERLLREHGETLRKLAEE